MNQEIVAVMTVGALAGCATESTTKGVARCADAGIRKTRDCGDVDTLIIEG